MYSSSVAPRRLRTDIVTSARPLHMDIHLQSLIVQLTSLMIAMSKPAYLAAVLEHYPSKPLVVFVPSRRQCRITVDD